MIDYLYTHRNKYIDGKGTNYEDALKKHKLSPKTFPSTELLCMFVQKPSEEEIKKISADFEVEEKYFHKFKSDTRSLRYSFDPLVFSFTDYYTDNNNHIRIARLLFVIKENVLLLVVADESRYFQELFDKVKKSVISRKLKSEAYLLYEFLHQDTKENYDVLERMDDKISILEQRIIESKQADGILLKEIMSIKRELIKMNKRLWASSKVIFTIKKDLTSLKLSREEMALLDDIYDTLMHQIDLIETQKETVTDFLEIFTTTISNRLASTSNELNVVMKKMAALTIIIMVATFFASLYGMNFVHMPELNWIYGYGFALLLMVISASLTYYFFHKKKWV